MKKLEYTPQGFSDYLRDLKKGDHIIVKRDGRNLNKTVVSSRGAATGVVRADNDCFSLEDGVSEKSGFRIMCPSATVIRQWEICERRRGLADRANAKFSHKRCMSLCIEDLTELAEIIGIDRDWLHSTDKKHFGKGTLREAIADAVKQIWRYDRIVKMEMEDLEYITDMMEGRLQD